MMDFIVVFITDLVLLASVDALNVTVIRALRLCRLLRVLRLARRVQNFESLYLMTTALSGSTSVLFWVLVMLTLINTLFALLVTNIIQSFYLSSRTGLSEQQQREIFVYFGTYWRSM